MKPFCTRYDSLQQRPTLRGRARKHALDFLSSVDFRHHHALSAPRIHFIYLHHVFEDEITAFRNLLSLLTKQNTAFISHSSAIQKLRDKEFDKPYISFSFDDGLKNCLTAAEILDEFDAKACFFINGKTLVNDSEQSQRDFCKDRLNMPPCRFLNWDDINRLHEGGHEIGNHMYSHLNSADLTLQQFVDEFETNHELFKSQGMHLKHFAWPYGQEKHILSNQLDYVRKETEYLSSSSAVRGAYLASSAAKDQHYICRDHSVAAWPLTHTSYLLSKSIRDPR